MSDTDLKVVDLRSNNKAKKVAKVLNETLWRPCAEVVNLDGTPLEGNRKNGERYNDSSPDMIVIDFD